MRQGSNPKRARGRGNNGRNNSNPRSNSYDSNGPEVKVRGNAQQVVEKYLALARDATLIDDRVAAENYFQHAEHYFRLMTANGEGEEKSDQAGSQSPGPKNQQHKDSRASEETGESPDAPEAQSTDTSVNGNRADEPAATVDDPASAPQPEIGDGDSSRPD
ncbi:MAG: DUF4167 domain-containing protein [Rhodospirillales bacterium]|nr:DUF4167 domain-containing protein [Rhodospirillales bacterium]